jgi:uncharacterized protein with beta-barrel porin domain
METGGQEPGGSLGALVMPLSRSALSQTQIGRIGGLLVAGLVGSATLGAERALASCDPVPGGVSCTGTTTNYSTGPVSGFTVTVQPGATVNGIFPSNAIEISTTPPFAANQLINNGTINGFVVILSAGPGVDSFTNNGILTVTDPNAPLQTHSMFGSAYIQSAAGTLFARVDANGFNDGIFAWNAVLSGKLAVVIQPGTYVTPIQYSIIQAFTGFTGQFTSLTFSSPFFTGTIDPSGGDDVLTLNAIPFNAVAGLTRNQQAVANALQAAYLAGPTGDAATFFANLFAAGSVGVFDQISGEGTAALQNASFAAGSQFNYAALNQLLFGDASGTTSVIIPPSQYAATSKPRGADAFASVLKAPPAPATQVGRWRLWTVGFGGYRSIDGNAFPIGSANQTIRNYGGALGADYQLAPDLLVGFAAGGSGASVSVPDRATTGDLTGGHFGLYGLKTWGPAMPLRRSTTRGSTIRPTAPSPDSDRPNARRATSPATRSARGSSSAGRNSTANTP